MVHVYQDFFCEFQSKMSFMRYALLWWGFVVTLVFFYMIFAIIVTLMITNKGHIPIVGADKEVYGFSGTLENHWDILLRINWWIYFEFEVMNSFEKQFNRLFYKFLQRLRWHSFQSQWWATFRWRKPKRIKWSKWKS